MLCKIYHNDYVFWKNKLLRGENRINIIKEIRDANGKQFGLAEVKALTDYMYGQSISMGATIYRVEIRDDGYVYFGKAEDFNPMCVSPRTVWELRVH